MTTSKKQSGRQAGQTVHGPLKLILIATGVT